MSVIYWKPGEEQPDWSSVRSDYPESWEGTFNYRSASDARHQADGWFHFDYALPSAGCRVLTYHAEKVAEGDGERVVQVIDTEENIEESAAQAHAMYIQTLATSPVGALVTLLRNRLVVLGFDLPVDYDEVMASIVTRSLAETLSDSEDRAKTDVSLCYETLSSKMGMTDGDIADVWAYLQSNA